VLMSSRSVRDCRELYRHENIRKLDAKLPDRTRRRIDGEEFRVSLVKPRKIPWFGEQHVNVDHILELRTGGAQNVVAVEECLPGLFLDRRSGQLIDLWIDADNAGQIYHRANLDGLTEQRGAGRVRRADDLFVHLGAPRGSPGWAADTLPNSCVKAP